MADTPPEPLAGRTFTHRTLRGSRFVDCDLGEVVVRGSEVAGMEIDSPWLMEVGSRLLVKLAGIFALVGLLPGLVIYTVSYQFVSRSIEAWFDVKVAGALDSGLALGKDTLDTLATDLAGKARVAAERLAESRSVSPLALERLREQIGAMDETPLVVT